VPLAREWAELLVEAVPAAGRVDDEHFRVLVRQVEECMRQAGRHEREAASFQHTLLFADPDLEAAGEDVERLLLLVVDVKGRAASRRDLDHEIVERAAGVVAGDLEDEIAAGAGLQPQAFVRSKKLGTEHGRHRGNLLDRKQLRDYRTISSILPAEAHP
jgi:hypothetical protein